MAETIIEKGKQYPRNAGKQEWHHPKNYNEYAA